MIRETEGFTKCTRRQTCGLWRWASPPLGTAIPPSAWLSARGWHVAFSAGTSQVAWKVLGVRLHHRGVLCSPRCLHWRWPHALLEKWEWFPKNRWEDISVPVPDPGVSHHHKARLLQQHRWVLRCLPESGLGEEGAQTVPFDHGHAGLSTGRSPCGLSDLPVFYAEAAVPATDFHPDSYVVWKDNPSSRSHQVLTWTDVSDCTGYMIFSGRHGPERHFKFDSWFSKESFP